MSVPVTGIITMRNIDNGNETVVVPVNPEEFSIGRGRNFHEVEVLGFRQVGRVGNLQLDRLSWESFFPAFYDESYCNLPEVLAPHQYAQRIGGWLENRQRIVVTISGTPFYKTMVLTDFTYGMRAGSEVGELNYRMDLREYVATTITVVDYVARPSRPAGPGAATGGTYTIVGGDTLWGIAKRYYGQGSLWPIIWDANKPMRSGNPNLIFPGEVITIPPH